MAYSMKKKIRIRISRFADQLMLLRPACSDESEARKLDQLLREVSALADRADVIFAEDSQVATATTVQRAQPIVVAAPTVAKSASASTVHVAAQKGMAARMVEDDDFQALPHDMTDEEKAQAMIDGRMGGVYDGEAAQKLYADKALWNRLTPAERLVKIAEMSEHLAATDERADEWPVLGGEPAPEPEGGVVF